MAKELLWNEDNDSVYGWANEYESKEDFEKAVKAGYEDGECKVYDIVKKLCISTTKGIEAETLCPVEETDIEMEWFYIAQVEPIEECASCSTGISHEESKKNFGFCDECNEDRHE